MTAESPGASNQTFLAADVVGFGDQRRTTKDQLTIRAGLYLLMRLAIEGAGIAWDRCHIEDRGDGLLVMAPADIPPRLFTAALPGSLVVALNEYNRRQGVAARIRLRVALHRGEVYRDAHGMAGVDLNLVFRLLDAAELRRSLAESQADLALIVSHGFFATTVRDDPESRPEIYRQVRVEIKETRTTAWVCLPGSPRPPHVPASDRRGTCDFFICYAGADLRWAEWIAWQLREWGYVVELDSGEVPAGQNFARWISDSLDRADRVLVVLSPDFIRSTRTMPETDGILRAAPGAVMPVWVRHTGPTLFDMIAGLDLIGAGVETARRRLLAALPRGESRPRSGPVFPGPRSVPVVPAFPGDSPPRGKALFSDEPAPVAADQPLVLVVHAADDHEAAVELADALRALETEGMLAPVELRPVGRLDEETEQYVDERVRRADIVLLVVSRELVATGYGASAELRLLIRRHELREATALPCILRPTSWERQPFGRLAALPSEGIPVSEWTSRDEAIKNIVAGVRLVARGRRDVETSSRPPRDHLPVLELGEVFKQTGLPTLTFVEPEEFFEFKMALRQPGLGVVLEGPSGVGKTTLLRHTVLQDADRLGEVPVLSARRPADVVKIRHLLDGHTGLVAVDDFQRLPAELQDQLADYLKLLADDDEANGKLVIVGIPGTAHNLIELSPDIATRVRVFRLGRVADDLLVHMMEKGEAALNITFDRKPEIALASAGSLLTAQMLCLSLAMMAGIEQTVDSSIVVHTDIDRARRKVAEHLHHKYGPVVNLFAMFDGPGALLCIELLLRLAKTTDGIYRLDELAELRPDLRGAIEQVFLTGLPDGLTEAHREVARYLFYDPRGRRLIADDPQFMFYLRQLTLEGLLDLTGKRLPVPRDQIFICYSHKDAEWKERVCVHLRPRERDGAIDVWSDTRIGSGDQWRREIAAALDRARVALLLISADFFDSDFIHAVELPSLLTAAEGGGCRVIPILVSPSMFHDIPELERFQSTPGNTTLAEMTREGAERVLVQLARDL